MKMRFIVAVASLLLPGLSQAAEIKLLASSAVKDACLELIPQFEKASGHKVSTAWSSTPDVQKRIAAGEAADVIILGDSGTEELIKQGKLAPGSRANFAKSGIGVAVRAGAPKPDVSSAEAVKRSVLTAKIRRLLCRSERRLSRQHVPEARPLRRGQSENGRGEARRTGGRGGRARRRRDRVQPDERAHSREGHRNSWTAAGRDPEHHRIFGRHFTVRRRRQTVPRR
jgi:hypothetical protein